MNVLSIEEMQVHILQDNSKPQEAATDGLIANIDGSEVG